jgi:hypothetical protein
MVNRNEGLYYAVRKGDKLVAYSYVDIKKFSSQELLADMMFSTHPNITKQAKEELLRRHYNDQDTR